MADEKKFPLEQDPQAYALDMMRRDGAVLAIKASPVLVRKAMPGEMIRTWSQDGVETVNSAGEDSFVLTKADRSTGKAVIDANGHDNSWIIDGDAFREAYRLGPDFNGEGIVDPIADLRTLVKVDKDMSVMASWGEQQSVSKGGYLNITDPNNIYAVSERDFDDTHIDAPMAAKFIDPSDDNPFWVQAADLAHQLDIAKEADEDTYDEACRQADALGTASLTEDQQVMVDVMGRKGLEQAWQFLDDTGFDSGKQPHEIDTGRYLQIRFIGSNGPPLDVYESVPQTVDGKVQHEFWDVTRDYHGRMTMPESDFEILGVYDGKPFQLARDAIAKEIDEVQKDVMRRLETSGPVTTPYLDAQSAGRGDRIELPRPKDPFAGVTISGGDDIAPHLAPWGGGQQPSGSGPAPRMDISDRLQMSASASYLPSMGLITEPQRSSAVQKMMDHVEAQNASTAPDGPSGPTDPTV